MKIIEIALRQTYDDYCLSKSEKFALKDVLSEYQHDKEILNYARNQAFELVKKNTRDSGRHYLESLKWLEHVIKTIDSARNDMPEYTQSAHFSPGDACLNKIISLIKTSKISIDVCVFTISDNRIGEALTNAHEKGIKLRIISDNEKSTHKGSDIDYFVKTGIKVKIDNSPNHMHHKFAVFDGISLVNGSFNWTRSASKYNYENIFVTNDQEIVNNFIKVYDDIWKKCYFHEKCGLAHKK